MLEWYASLSVLEEVFFWIAVVASLALVVQLILLLVSFGGGGLGDTDLDLDGDIGTDSGLALFSVKSITAFFALGGWCGFAAAGFLPGNNWAPILIFFVTGALALLAVAFALRGISKLQCAGNVDNAKLEGMIATVYVSIPGARSGRGKVTLTAQGRYMELDAVTDGDRLPVDTVVVIDEYNEDFAVVSKKQ